MLQRGTPNGAPQARSIVKPAMAKKQTAPAADAGAEDLLSGVLGGKKAVGGGAGGAEASDDVLGDLGKKRKAPRTTFRERNVLDMKGLFKLYQEMQKLPLSRKPGNEVRHVPGSGPCTAQSSPRPHPSRHCASTQLLQAADMQCVSNAYRTWAAQIFPPLTAAEVLRKCREWSGKTLVKNVLGVMRTAEADREARGALSASDYAEMTEGARRAAEAEAEKRKDKAKQRGVALDGGSVGSNREDDEYEVDEGAEEELDFIERQRRARGGGEDEYEEEEEDELEVLQGGAGSGMGGGAGRRAAEPALGASQEAGGSSQDAYADEFGDYLPAPSPAPAPEPAAAGMVELEDSEGEQAPPPPPRRRGAEIEEDDD